jgi:hypothetical protein
MRFLWSSSLLSAAWGRDEEDNRGGFEVFSLPFLGSGAPPQLLSHPVEVGTAAAAAFSGEES